MRLQKIIIDNFLSIEHLELDCDNLTVFIGPNNHGKTNILKALDVFFNGSKNGWKDFVTKTVEKDISVKCLFSNVKKFLPLINKTNREAFSKNILEDDSIWFERKFTKDSKTSEINVFDFETKTIVNNVGIPNANTILPKFEFIPTKLLLEDATKIQKNNYLGKMLFDIFDKVTPEEDKQYLENWANIERYFNERDDGHQIKELNELESLIYTNLKSEFPECVKVNLKVELPAVEDIIKGFKIKINDGEWTDASDKGDGMQRGLMFSIIKSYSDLQKKYVPDEKQTEKDQIKREQPILFAIDEAELHLHPQSQRDLMHTLEAVSSGGDQVVFTTHSYLLAKQGQNKKIYAVKKENGRTVKLPSIKNDLLDLMGIVPGDSGFPDNIIIVEGESDEKFIKKIIELLNLGKNINIHFSGGDTNIINASEAINQMLRTVFYIPYYKDAICAIFDKQNNQRNINDFKSYVCRDETSQFCRILELDKNAIEFYYPKSILQSFFDEPANINVEQNIKTFLDEIHEKAKRNEELKSQFGNLGLVSKRDLADHVVQVMTGEHLNEIDDKIILLINKAIELAF